MSALLNLKAPTPGKGMSYVKDLYSMFNTINVHVRSLANNGIEGELLGTVFCPLIVATEAKRPYKNEQLFLNNLIPDHEPICPL